MRTAVRSISAVGCLTFLALFVATLAGPRLVERHARQYLIERVGEEAQRNHPALSRLGAAVAELQALSALCKHDCLERPAAAHNPLLSWARGGLDRVRDWAQGRFTEMIDRVLRDVRIFALTNALMFLLAFLAASADPAPRALTIIAAALVVGAAIGTGLYVFGQDWLYTILFADYVGAAYVVWVVLIVAAELDLLLNRGRIIGALVEGVVSAVGTVLSAASG